MVHQVFAIRELLEYILSHVDMQTLLLAQRVNREFQAQIKISPKLQRALFFRPEEPGTTPIYEEEDGNLAHGRLSPPGFHRTALRKIQAVQLNPLLLQAFPWLGTNPLLAFNVEEYSLMPWANAPEAFRRKDASWRKMLVSQPPATSLFIDDHRPQGLRKTPQVLSRTATWGFGLDGLRMGALSDLVFETLAARAFRWKEKFAFMMLWPGNFCYEQEYNQSLVGKPGLVPLAEKFRRRGYVVMPLMRDGELVFACRICVYDCAFMLRRNEIEEYKSDEAMKKLGIRWEKSKAPRCSHHYPWPNMI